MYCSRCGHKVVDAEALFCSRCGTILPRLPASQAPGDRPGEEPGRHVVDPSLAPPGASVELSDPWRDLGTFQNRTVRPAEPVLLAPPPVAHPESSTRAAAPIVPAEPRPLVPVWPGRAALPAGDLQVAGCTLRLQGEDELLALFTLDATAALLVPPGRLVWLDPSLHVERPPHTLLSEQIRVRGPGTLSVSPGVAHSVLPLPLSAGDAIDVAPVALLALTAGGHMLRSISGGPFIADSLVADQPALVVLRLRGAPYIVGMTARSSLIVAPPSLACKDASVALTPARGPVPAYRLVGPGRVILHALGSREQPNG